ncbi:glycosyltransferase family 4 protein [Candidatus Daviesbacteria bacterium]|nr:glycosyltransferase family 4 protein [Candidatus Daviesbacteria bacterium]
MLVSDYYPPFNPGGSEWSVLYLSKALQDKDINNIIVTPNYGTRAEEIIVGTRVIRFPSFKKASGSRSVINPIWQNNPFFFIWSAVFIYKIAKKEKVDILHIHGKFLIPGGYCASKLLKVPFIVTIRDKQLLCSYGKCFFTKDRKKSCSWIEYMTSDLPWFYKHFVKEKKLSSLIYTFLSALWTRIVNSLIVWFAKNSDKIIAISNSQKTYLEAGGFKDVKVIFNSVIFQDIQPTKKRSNILFVGKLSLGKGIYQLLEAIPFVIQKRKELFIFAGGVEEKKDIDAMVKKLGIREYVKFLGGVDHFKLQKLYKSCKLVVMPSIYPEAFGRVALEALSAGTPVVVSNRGGLPEIVRPKYTGLISKVTPEDLALAINTILNNLDMYIKNINKERLSLIKKFGINPINQHAQLYKILTRKHDLHKMLNVV